jgi:GDPmannose 4,6-dehydratase
MGVVRLRINPEFFRPNELHVLIGDSKKAFEVLGWKPTTTFEGLVKEMVEADCRV